ncbi:MAG: DNA gyrase subunit A [Mesotoga sp.]|uniref:DNA gyrase subunit A n=1 Tax=unclassified Mesotoga TaxID=1184398 RepID=UPI000EF22E37|nr:MULTISPECIES: DNA gyrase subunit A [unclassified Mesotoga]MDI9369049.1 DNA gyrase subunit A [Thermotogota bacterium]NLT45500.1 DNA gyrase subunit A [Thermotogaceae bacterium]MDD2333525.1 DNA gyrase subunit A [Mesotoga sp.]MDD3680141.1 DNA gyrase subunit A [Mesotoga sp.]MDD4206398.1 DNA gyrase subunit A [Mesotoga sp.]
MPEEIIHKNIDDELINSYMLYSMSVIVGRAIPDLRDGLKPVQRRILFGMSELGLRHNQGFKKSARIVGEVMGKFHPHGDAAIYDALVRMAQSFSMRYPLVEGQGNFGSIDRDPPAAMRYTEARMQSLSEELLQDIDKNTVPMLPNFDGSLSEPDVLPTKIPNLLLNGTSGIAVGMMTSIPPHNLIEIVEAVNLLISDPECTVSDLLKYVKGPDFPTGGMIMDAGSIPSIYQEGKGRMTVRAIAEIEESAGSSQIVVHEIPYNTSKADLIQQIVNATQNHRDLQIRNIRDESDQKGLRVVIELKRGADPNVVLNLLFKHTQLQTTFSVNMLVIDEKKRPRVLNLKQILQGFLSHRFNVIRAKTEYDLEQASRRAHIVEGLTKATRSIDTVVDIIRNSANAEEASKNLMETLEVTQEQSSAILDMRMGKLTGMEIEKLLNEYRDLVAKINEYRLILASDEKVYEIIQKELGEIKEKYGDARRTKIDLGNGTDFNIEDVIPDEEIVLMVTKKGYIKSTPLESYRKQGRGGKGVIGVRTGEEDFVVNILTTTRLSKTVIITSKGKAYVLSNHIIDHSSRDSKGKLLANYIKIDPDENVQAVLSTRREEVKGKHLVITTRSGKIKKTEFEAFLNVRVSGIKAISLNESDRVIDASLTTKENDTIIISTKNGMVIRFSLEQVRSMGRSAAGVMGIRLKKNDEVVGANIVAAEDERFLLTATQKGGGKRTRISEYRCQNRGGLGVKNIYGLEKIGQVIGTLVVNGDDGVILATKSGMSIRIPISQVRPTGRVTKGVRIVDLKENDIVATMAVVVD